MVNCARAYPDRQACSQNDNDNDNEALSQRDIDEAIARLQGNSTNIQEYWKFHESIVDQAIVDDDEDRLENLCSDAVLDPRLPLYYRYK